MILASWFKARHQGLSLKGTVPDLINSRNLTNLTSKESWSKDTYFSAYQKSFKEGEYNYQEPVSTPYGQVIRSYFSGGFQAGNLAPVNPGTAASTLGGGKASRQPTQQNIHFGKRFLASLLVLVGSGSDATNPLNATIEDRAMQKTVNEAPANLSPMRSKDIKVDSALAQLKENLRPKAKSALTDLVPGSELDKLVDNLLDAIAEAHLVGISGQGPYTNQEIWEKARILNDRMNDLGLDKELARKIRRALMEKKVTGIEGRLIDAETNRNLWEDRVAYLETAKHKIENNQLPDVINFGDKHGKATDLERILGVARQAARDGKRLAIIGHGDVFDRGNQNFRNFEILQELKNLAEQNRNISVRLCLGNHDVWLIQALLLNDHDAMDNWRPQGGQAVINEFQRKGDDAKRLALWALQKMDIFHIDERGFLHLHAGIPADENGSPLIDRRQLNDWQARLISIQHRLRSNPGIMDDLNFRQEVARLFEEAQQVFWIREDEWINNLIEGRIEGRIHIDESNRDRLFNLLENAIREQTSSTSAGLSEEQIKQAVEQGWAQALIQHENEFRQVGIRFEVDRKPPVVNKNKLDNFMACLGVNGVVFGHIHLKQLLNLDNRIFCVDVDEEDAGHLIFNGNGIRFSAAARSTDDLIATTQDILANIDEQIIRAKTRLGQPTQTEEAALVRHVQQARVQGEIIKTRLNASQAQASFSKDNMRRFKLGLVVGWGNGAVEFSVRESTSERGALRIWDIKIGGIAVPVIVVRDGRRIREDSLLVREGDSLRIGRDRTKNAYYFKVGRRTYGVELEGQSFALIERFVIADESRFTLSRTLINNSEKVVVATEQDATSQTKIQPVLVVSSREEAMEILKEITRGMEFGFKGTASATSAQPADKKDLITVQPVDVRRRVDVEAVDQYLRNLYLLAQAAGDANAAVVYNRTLKLIAASIYNDPNILIQRGPMSDEQCIRVSNQLYRFRGDNLDAIIQQAGRKADYGPIRDELARLSKPIEDVGGSSNIHFGASPNEVDAGFIAARHALDARDYLTAKTEALKAIIRFRDTPTETTDGRDDIPIADDIEQPELAIGVLRALVEKGATEPEIKLMLDLLLQKKNGQKLKELLRTSSPGPAAAAQDGSGETNRINAPAAGTTGGIDFRSLPIVTQAISNLRMNMDIQVINRMRGADVSRELGDIQRTVDAGISPSGERIKEYVQASSVQGNLDIDKVVNCISDILRLEEERCCQTEAVVKDILVVLESARSNQELKEIFVGNT